MKKNLLIIIIISLISFTLGWFFSKKSESKNTSASTVFSPSIKPKEVKKATENNALVYEYHLQLGAFKVPYFASQLAHKVKKRGYTVILRNEEVKSENYNLVEVGPFTKYSQALKHKKFLEKDNPSLGKISIKKRIKD